ncbi:MAG: NAD(P)H-hydrate epimerase [Actinobacteria bacterium]|nr:MAG: NAD(P)H-hydrate epimerase [Actinomycetota bacterium]
MKPVLTPAEAAILDRETQARGIDAASLMERAGRQVARAATAVAGGFSGRRAVVVCGKGNNGGDGLVAARHLRRWGIRTTVVMMQPPEAFGEPAATNFLRLGQTDVRVRPFSPDTLARELARSDVAVDAMFGTGFRGSPEGDWERAIAGLNDWGGPVVAVDIPSGVNGETGAVKGVAVTADVTVTFGAAKIGIVLLPGALHAGLVEVVDIGFPADLLRADVWLSEGEDVAAVLPVRPPDTHKRDAGVVVVIGGSRSMTGAVSLMGEAAYRAGAGLVSVAVPEGILPVVQAALRETTFIPLPATDAGTVAGRIDRLDEVVRSADAVAIGPGMTTNEETAAFIRSFVRSCGRRPHPACRRVRPARRHHRGRGRRRPRGPRPKARVRHPGHRPVEGEPNRDRLTGGPGSDQPHRRALPRHRGDGRRADGDDRRADRAGAGAHRRCDGRGLPPRDRRLARGKGERRGRHG